MRWTPYHHWMWFWCWLCYRAYILFPIASNHHTRYGRGMLWILGYGGAYASSDRSNFHLCIFFYRSVEEQNAAWDRHIGPVAKEMVKP